MKPRIRKTSRVNVFLGNEEVWQCGTPFDSSTGRGGTVGFGYTPREAFQAFQRIDQLCRGNFPKLIPFSDSPRFGNLWPITC